MKPIHINQLKDLLQMVGLETMRHPLIHILKLESINQIQLELPIEFSFGFYSVGLIRNMRGNVECGKRSYDFNEGTMFFLAPNQLVGHALEAMKDADGWLIFFHRSYLAKHQLENEIDNYGFFDYHVNEALHLSQKEEQEMERLFENIFSEHQNPIDAHSRSVTVSNLELLFTYSNRYYGRQFITRNDVENTFLIDFDRILNAYFRNTSLEENGIPKVADFADTLNMSVKYLGDKLRVLTGKTAQEYINLKLIEGAKVLLMQKELSVSEIAFQMGFEYPQYFSRFFKKRVGVSPKVFQSLN